MMNPQPVQASRTTSLLTVLMVLLATACWWCYGALDRAADAASAASSDLAQCRKLAASIERLRQRPLVAGSHEMQLAELTQQIETAAKQSVIPSTSVVRIWPEPPRRVGDSPYQEKPTQILLREVTLKQASSFLHALSQPAGADSAGLRVASLRFTAPRDQETGSAWTVETTVSYLIYSPVNRNLP